MPVSRLLLVFLLFAVAAQPARSQQAARELQEDVARESARRELWYSIRNTELLPGWTVGAYLDEVGPPGALQDALGRAESIGGARWLNAKVCQFHLQLDGRVVSDLLVVLARLGGPLHPDDVAKGSRGWLSRPFVATGTAISVDALTELQPPAGATLWRAVSKAQRVAAVKAAHGDAVISANHADAGQLPVTRLTFFNDNGVACVEVEILLHDTGEAFVGKAIAGGVPGDAGSSQ